MVIQYLTCFIYFVLINLFLGQRLAKNLGPLFKNVVIEPCLLHGDLWSGNITYDKNGEPVILDPACYCKSWVHSFNIINQMVVFAFIIHCFAYETYLF